MGDFQNGRGVRLYHKVRLYHEDYTIKEGGEITIPHKYITNASACGTTRSEHLLDTGRRHQTSKKASQSLQNEVGQKIQEK